MKTDIIIEDFGKTKVDIDRLLHHNESLKSELNV